MGKYFKLVFFLVAVFSAKCEVQECNHLSKEIEELRELIKSQDSANKQFSQAIADMRDELLERPIDIDAERAKFAKNLETDLTVDKLTPEQKKEYDLYDSTLKWLKKNGIKIYSFGIPSKHLIKGLSKKELCTEESEFHPDKKNGLFEKVFGSCKACADYWTNERRFVQNFNDGKTIKYMDLSKDHVNILNGIRLGYPVLSGKLNIRFLGPCTSSGLFASDFHTIESILKKTCEESSNKSINTINYANNGLGYPEKTMLNCFKRIRDTPLLNEDIICLISWNSPSFLLALKNNDVPYFELSHLFDEPNNYGDWFITWPSHCNCTANRVIAKYIYKILKPEIDKYDEKKPRKYVRMDDINDPAEKAEYLKQNPDFFEWLYSLKEIRKQYGIKGNVGSIVMHCNPFTLGHRYLIETAAKQVDKLVIFVVEEETGDFPSKDRLDLVRKGTADLKNVIVIPSSKFFASFASFPEYFVKGQKKGEDIDPSKDINLFVKYIAPVMGIKSRFVGEEPYDPVTKKLNDTMRDYLPTFGLKLIEIKRKATDEKEDFISASKVRKLLEENKWEELKKYVPQTTYDYLKNRTTM